MDAKKMKIILGVSVVANIALVVLMFTLKSGYEEQAKAAVSVSTKAYTDQVAKVVEAQNSFIQTGNLIWDLAFESLNSADRSLNAFNARLAALDTAHQLQVTKDGNKTLVSCGESCNVIFEFAGGKLAKVDYSALASITPESLFPIAAPPAFQFQAK